MEEEPPVRQITQAAQFVSQEAHAPQTRQCAERLQLGEAHALQCQAGDSALPTQQSNVRPPMPCKESVRLTGHLLREDGALSHCGALSSSVTPVEESSQNFMVLHSSLLCVFLRL